MADPVNEYIRGKLYEMEYGWDVDEISSIELDKQLKLIGYGSYKCLWYRHPERDLSNGLRELNNDQDVRRFNDDVKGHSLVDVYVEHLIETLVFGEKFGSSEVEVVEIPVGGLDNDESEDCDDPEYENSGLDEVECGDDGQGEELDSEDDISLDDSDYDEVEAKGDC